jgi:LPXTG-motif cell wall-anchored protein
MLRKQLTGAILAAAFVCGTATLASAQELRSDRATYFTFSQPVALPTGTLPAGRYLFRLADSQATRSVVQVYTDDGAKLIGMMLTLPATRDRVSDEPEVRFLESAENAPPAIGTWWYPGMKNGWEFIYPREQAMKLAQTSKQGVLTTATDTKPEDMKDAELVRLKGSEQTPVSGSGAAITPAGQSQRGELAKVTSPEPQTPQVPAPQPTPPQPVSPEPPAPQPTVPQQTTPATPQQTTPATPPPTTTPQPTTATTPAQTTPATPRQTTPATPQQTSPRTTPATPSSPDPATRSELPHTASATPLVLAIGVLALSAGLGLGFWRRRMA